MMNRLRIALPLLAALLFSSAAHAHVRPSAEAETAWLRDFVLALAKFQLTRQETFMPIGAALTSAGAPVSLEGAKDATSMLPAELIKEIQDIYIRKAASGEFKATALAYDATVPLPSSGQDVDAIAVALDHKSGTSTITFFPYTRVKGTLQLGEPYTRQGTGTIFKKE